MSNYSIIYEKIQDRYDSGNLTYETACELNTRAYEKYGLYEEGIKDVVNKVKEKAVTTAVDNSGKYMKGLNKRGEKFAEAITKKPNTEGKPAYEHIILTTEYCDKLRKIKNAYKVGEILAIEGISLVIPFTTIPYTSMLSVGMANSKDPDDKAVQDKVKGIISNIKGIGDKIISKFKKDKGKEITPEDKKEIDRLYEQGYNAAKEGERLINKAKAKAVNESVEEIDNFNALESLFDTLLTLDDPTKAIENFMESCEYDEYTYDTIERYINVFL